MISKYSHKELVWTDLEAPHDTEIDHILDEYQIPSIIKEEMEMAKTEDIIRLYNEYIFVSLYFPQLSVEKSVDNRLIFIACDKYIVSIHNEPIHELSAFLKEMELSTMEFNKMNINDNKTLFAHLLKSLYVNSHRQIIIQDNKIRNLKSQMAKNQKQLKTLINLVLLSIIIILIAIYGLSYI